MFCLLVTACTSELSNEVLDGQWKKLQTAWAANDEDQLSKLVYFGDFTEEEFHDFFHDVLEYWPVKQDDVYSLVQLDIKKANDYNQWTGVYSGITDGQAYLIEIVYLESEEINEIVSFRVALEEYLAAESTQYEPSGVLHWIVLAYWIVCLIAVFVSIVDVFRKKPRRYGLWILLMLVFAGVCYSIGGGHVEFKFVVGLFYDSWYEAFTSGGFILQVTVPFGVIFYWCRRKSLLKAKAQKEKPVENFVKNELHIEKTEFQKLKDKED